MKIGFGNAIVSGQRCRSGRTERLERGQEGLNPPPPANRFDDLHGNLHTPKGEYRPVGHGILCDSSILPHRSSGEALSPYNMDLQCIFFAIKIDMK